MEDGFATLSKIVRERESAIVARWRQLLAEAGGSGRIKDAEVEKQCQDFLASFVAGLSAGATFVTDPAYAKARELLGEVSR